MEQQQHIVCIRCAKIKQACSGDSPCSRCKRLDVDCIPSTLDAKSVAAAELISKPVKITRTHTGCVTCKRRKRKCDEARPKCSDCTRLCLECHYRHPPIRIQRKSISHASTTTQSSSSSSSENPGDTYAPEDADHGPFDINFEDFERMVDWRSLDDSTDMWTLSPQSHTIADEMDDNMIPFRSNLTFQRLSVAPLVTVDEDKMLLNHYTKVVATVLSRRDDRSANPFLSKVLPVAFSNVVVMEAVLALSASHWKRLNPSIWKGGAVHQTKALQSLVKLLPRVGSDSVDAALLTILLLAMTDLFDGVSSHWKYHLDGVRRLLSSFEKRNNTQQQTEYRAFYHQLYHYLDSATTISTCQPPSLEAAETAKSKTPPYSKDDEESLYGIPKTLFHFVDKLNGLAYQRKFRDDPVFDSMFQASATSLQDEIEQWIDDYKLRNFGNGNAIDLCPPTTAASHATTAFEQALQLRLHQVVNGYSLDHEIVRQYVSSILESIQEIRYGSPLESSLIFPLVMAGTSCDTEYERQIVRDRFLVMERTLGFQYVSIAYDLVQRVWKEREKSRRTGKEVNWAAIRYYDIPGLVLV